MYSGYLSTPGSQRSSVAPEYSRRSPSPSPSSTSSKDAPERTNSRMLTRRPVSGQSIASLQQQHHIMATQQPQQISPTLHHSASSSALSIRSMSTSRIDDDEVGSEDNTVSVESKVAKEGWIFKKNSLMVMNPSWSLVLIYCVTDLFVLFRIHTAMETILRGGETWKCYQAWKSKFI